ncbi:hypothetical protein [Streptomyces sp. V4I2]|uniref:hypothetical protein n=1 Tax=Streptomyces sp. V4I2 TaxID=3042280 RepID=UPI0027880A2B|nr:hypothetical protein [Streptomyces sp. V4I2]MDQ1050286.1 hypothetical protein [Streptomyces sp. V4I2]
MRGPTTHPEAGTAPDLPRTDDTARPDPEASHEPVPHRHAALHNPLTHILGIFVGANPRHTGLRP